VCTQLVLCKKIKTQSDAIYFETSKKIKRLNPALVERNKNIYHVSFKFKKRRFQLVLNDRDCMIVSESKFPRPRIHYERKSK